MILLSTNSFDKSARLYKWNTDGEYWSNYIKLDSDDNIQTYFTTNIENPATNAIEYLSNTIGKDEFNAPINNMSIVESKSISQTQSKLTSNVVLTNRYNTYQKLFSIGNEKFLALTVKDDVNTIHGFTEIYRFDTVGDSWYIMQTLTIKSTNIQFLVMDSIQLLVCVDDNDSFITYEFDSHTLIFNVVQSIPNIRIPQGSSCAMQATKHTDDKWYIALCSTITTTQIDIYEFLVITKTFSQLLTDSINTYPECAILKSIDSKLLLFYSNNYSDYLGVDSEKNLVVKEIVDPISAISSITTYQNFQLTALTGMSIFSDVQNTYLIGVKQYVVNVSTVGDKFNYQLIQYRHDAQLDKFIQIPILSNNFTGGNDNNFNFEIANLVNYVEIDPNTYNVPVEILPIPTTNIAGDNCDDIVSYTLSTMGVTTNGFDTIHTSQKFGYFVIADTTNLLTIYRLEYTTSNVNITQYEYQHITLSNPNDIVQMVRITNTGLCVLALDNVTYTLYYYEFNNNIGFEYKFNEVLNTVGDSKINMYEIDDILYISHVKSNVELTINTIDTVNSQLNTIQTIQFPNGIFNTYKYVDNSEHYLVVLGYRINPNIVATTKIYKWGVDWLEEDSFESNYYTSAKFFIVDNNKFLCFTNGSITGQNISYKSIIFVKHIDNLFKSYQCLNVDMSNDVSYALVNNTPSLVFSTFYNKNSSQSNGTTEIYMWDGTYFTANNDFDRLYLNNTTVKLIDNTVDFPLLIDVSGSTVTFNSFTTTNLQRINVIENANTITGFDYVEIINNIDYTNFETIPAPIVDLQFKELTDQLYIVYSNNSDINSIYHPNGVNYNEATTIANMQFTFIDVPYSDYPVYTHPITTENNLVYSGVMPQSILQPLDDNTGNYVPQFTSTRIAYSYNYNYNNILTFNNIIEVDINCNLNIHVTNLETTQVSHFIQLYYDDNVNPITTNYITFNANIDSRKTVSKFNVFIAAGSILRFAAYGNTNIHIFSV